MPISKIEQNSLASGVPTNIATAQIANAAVTPAKLSQPLTSGTAVTASGTSVDFTGIPSWVKRITVMFNGVSTNGSSTPQIQLGSGSVNTSGYSTMNTVVFTVSNTTRGTTSSSGFGLSTTNGGGANEIYHGSFVFNLFSSNTWVGNGNIYQVTAAYLSSCAGISPTLSGSLDRIRITTINGTDAFDAGSINILYE